LPTINLLPYCKLITGFLLACVLSVNITAADSKDYSKRSVTQLIDDLTQIDSLSPGINSAATYYEGFIADDIPGSFQMGVLPVVRPKVPPQMRELVRRGPLALPELMKHLDDRRPTKLEVGNRDSASSSRQVGVDWFMFSYFSDEYDARLFNEKELGNRPRPMDMQKDFQGRYTVKVGDVCYVLIGQIVNRQLLAVRYQASGGVVVNSPIEVPALAEKVRNDWGHADAEMLKASLLADVRTAIDPQQIDQSAYRTKVIHSALQRLRLYFPDTYNALEGDDLKKRKEFEKQESKRQSHNSSDMSSC
jgi:hypothetical protein